jgi:hypothetical protein
MCKYFYKESFRNYESNVVIQSHALVKSYLSGVQQCPIDKVSDDPSKMKEYDDTSRGHSDDIQNMSIDNENRVAGGSNRLMHEMRDSSSLKDKTTSFGPSTEKQDTKIGDASPPKDKTTSSGPSNNKKDTLIGDGGPLKDKTIASGPSNEKQDTNMEDDSPVIDKIICSSFDNVQFVAEAKYTDIESEKVNELNSSSFDKKVDDASEPKYTEMDQKNVSSSNLDVDVNKKLPTEKGKKKSDPLIVKEDHAAQTKKDLSALGHRKRALKPPKSSFTNSISSGARIIVTNLEKEVYHAAARRPKGIAEKYVDAFLRKISIYDTIYSIFYFSFALTFLCVLFFSVICADIGRMSITHGEFSLTMAGGKWVGTFVMNVFAEALNADMWLSTNPSQVKKGYMTSAEVVSNFEFLYYDISTSLHIEFDTFCGWWFACV